MEIHEIVSKQRQFFNKQHSQPIAYRLFQLDRLEKLIKTYEKELLAALKKDLGKQSMEAYMTEIGLVYRSLNQMKKNLTTWLKPTAVSTPFYLQPAKSKVVKRSYGVCLIISPYNYPVLLAMDPLIGAIAGGNTVVLGLSEHTPYVNQVLFTSFQEFFCSNYIYLYESNQKNNQLVLKEQFDKIFFTGSPKVGQIVLEAASQHLTPTTLELGGKSPAVVLKDAKLKQAAERIVWGKFLNAGATCVAPDYVLVERDVLGPFLTEVKEALSRFYGRHPRRSKAYARIGTDQQLNRLIELLKADQDWLYLGGRYSKMSRYLSPTILLGSLDTPMNAMENEIFGPILPILVMENEQAGHDFIRQHATPLAFYLFTESKSKQTDWLATHQFGGATINDTILHLTNHQLPFGGIGQSGMGNYHGKYSLRAFTYDQAQLTRYNFPNLPVMHPPYTPIKKQLIRLFLK